MPMLIISTNIETGSTNFLRVKVTCTTVVVFEPFSARSKVSADLMRSCAQMFATAINKPVEKAMVHFQTGEYIMLN